MKYAAFPEYELIGVAGYERATQDGLLSRLEDLL